MWTYGHFFQPLVYQALTAACPLTQSICQTWCVETLQCRMRCMRTKKPLKQGLQNSLKICKHVRIQIGKGLSFRFKVKCLRKFWICLFCINPVTVNIVSGEIKAPFYFHLTLFNWNKNRLYLRQSTSPWAEFPLWMCPAQTHQSRGQLKGGRSSETLWLFGSWKHTRQTQRDKVFINGGLSWLA